MHAGGRVPPVQSVISLNTASSVFNNTVPLFTASTEVPVITRTPSRDNLFDIQDDTCNGRYGTTRSCCSIRVIESGNFFFIG